MKTLREVLGADVEVDEFSFTELTPTVLIDGDEYVPVNRGERGIELYKPHDMDDEEYSFTNLEIDNSFWNDEFEVWNIPAEVIVDGETKLSWSFNDGSVSWQVVEKILEYKVIKP